MTEHLFMSRGLTRMLATCDLHPSCNELARTLQWREIRYILRLFPKLGRSANGDFPLFSQYKWQKRQKGALNSIVKPFRTPLFFLW